MIYFYYMKHRGSLDEALKTKRKIPSRVFFYLYHKYAFTFYGYDERINCIRFIISDMTKYVNVPCWLLLEIK